jgi:hypothetical protein
MKNAKAIIAATTAALAVTTLAVGLGAARQRDNRVRNVKDLGRQGITSISATVGEQGITIKARAELENGVHPQTAWWRVELRDQRLQQDSVIWRRDYDNQPVALAQGVKYAPTFEDTIHLGALRSGRYNVAVSVMSVVPVAGPDGPTQVIEAVAVHSTWIDW